MKTTTLVLLCLTAIASAQKCSWRRRDGDGGGNGGAATAGATVATGSPIIETSATDETVASPTDYASAIPPVITSTPTNDAYSSDDAPPSPTSQEEAYAPTAAAPAPAPASAPATPIDDSAPAPPPDVGGMIPLKQSGVARTSRYHDCNKPACRWADAGLTTGKLQLCDANGLKTDDEENAYSCTDQTSWVVNENLAYGFAAVNSRSDCGKCFKLTFIPEFPTQYSMYGNPNQDYSVLAGKEMIVQVTNTGAGGNDDPWHFDIAMPVADRETQCIAQYGAYPEARSHLDADTECADMPDVEDENGISLKKRCKEFRFDFMHGIENPMVNYEEVECPPEITQVSGFQRA
jgi:hypothetical protein